MYTEFLHCNACFAYSSSSKEDQIRFWLTECGHVVCKSCLSKHGEASRDNSSNSTERTCPVCNAKCTAVELTDKLPSNLGAFFRSTHEILDEAADVMRFQKTNTVSLIEFLKDKVNKQRQMLDKAKNELLQFKDMKNELQNLKEENQRLKSQLQEARPSTSVKRPVESPTRLNASPRKLHKSPAQNRNLDISPSQTRQPRTPNPPKRLTLPTSTSPMCPSVFKHQSQQHDNCPSQYEYQSNNGLFNSQTAWNDGVGNYGYENDGDIGSGVLSQPSYDTRAMPPPSTSYSVPFAESNYNRLPQQISNTTYSRPGTASSTRMTWNELRNRNNTRNMARNGIKGPGLRVAAAVSKFQRQSTNHQPSLTYSPLTQSNYQPPSTPSNFRPPFPVQRKFQSSSDGFIAPPRTPVMRNRDALPGLNNRGW